MISGRGNSMAVESRKYFERGKVAYFIHLIKHKVKKKELDVSAREFHTITLHVES